MEVESSLLVWESGLQETMSSTSISLVFFYQFSWHNGPPQLPILYGPLRTLLVLLALLLGARFAISLLGAVRASLHL